MAMRRNESFLAVKGRWEKKSITQIATTQVSIFLLREAETITFVYHYGKFLAIDMEV